MVVEKKKSAQALPAELQPAVCAAAAQAQCPLSPDVQQKTRAGRPSWGCSSSTASAFDAPAASTLTFMPEPGQASEAPPQPPPLIPPPLPSCVYTPSTPPPPELCRTSGSRPSAAAGSTSTQPLQTTLRALHVSRAGDAGPARPASDWISLTLAPSFSAASSASPIVFSSALVPPPLLEPASTAASIPTPPPQPPKTNPWARPKAWTHLDAVRHAPGGLTIYCGAEPDARSAPPIAPDTPTSSVPQQQQSASGAALEVALDLAASNPLAPPVLPRGLVNTGNMCFANSILQALVHCAPFANLFRAKELREGPFAAVQSLALFPSLGEEAEPSGPGSAQLVRAMVDFVAQFALPKKEDPPSEPFVPTGVYDAMGHSARPALRAMQHGTTQHDAEEFLNLLLDALHDELLCATTSSSSGTLGIGDSAGARTPLSPPRAAAAQEGGWQAVTSSKVKAPRQASSQGKARLTPAQVAQTFAAAYYSVGKSSSGPAVVGGNEALSPIIRLFGGMTRSTLRYTTVVGKPGAQAGAGHTRQRESVTREAFLTLPVHIADPNVLRVEDALSQLAHVEEMGSSSTATETTRITKQVQLEQLPAVLIVQLKRFVFDPVVGTPQKLEKEVRFDEHLFLPPQTLVGGARTQGWSTGRAYRLTAVVYHHGTHASAGHYTVDVLRRQWGEEPDAWVHIDDTALTPVVSAAVVGKDSEPPQRGHDGTPYLLLYMREPAHSR